MFENLLSKKNLKMFEYFSENVENANPRGWIIGFWYD